MRTTLNSDLRIKKQREKRSSGLHANNNGHADTKKNSSPSPPLCARHRSGQALSEKRGRGGRRQEFGGNFLFSVAFIASGELSHGNEPPPPGWRSGKGGVLAEEKEPGRMRKEKK